MEQGISIIICCYNSADRVGETLRYVFALNVPDKLGVEVLLINNNSSDNTSSIALTVAEAFKPKEFRFGILDEPNPGLTNAKRLGIKESKYQLLLFCDDDNHLDSDYLCAAMSVVRADASIGIVGGWPKPKIAYYPGKWIDANFSALAIELTPRERGYKDWVFGAGMIIRKQIFKDLEDRGIRLILSGRQGKKQTSGEDAEICRLARLLGYKIFYDPTLMLGHAVASHRLTKRSFIRANYRNIFMVLYFRVLESLIVSPKLTVNKIYCSFLKESLGLAFYFLPRTILGRNRFFSFMIFYQNVQVILSLLFKRGTFISTYYTTKNNLYRNGSSGK